MPLVTKQLSNEWLNFAEASLATRIHDAEVATVKVLTAVQAIATQLDNKQALSSLLSIEEDQATSKNILPLLQDILKHLDTQDDLSQLIAPLYMALQFEDRTRQKLEGLLAMMKIWTEVRDDESLSEKQLAASLAQQIVSMEQQHILAKHFPDHIQAEEVKEEMEFF